MDVFEALGDPVRRSLLQRLADGPARVVDLAAEHPISRPAISRHLRVLVDTGLVAAEERGRERHYRLVRSGLAPVQAWVEALTRIDPPIPEHALDGLDLEVRRAGRERRPAPRQHTHEETA
ncbi:ArsR family transcriptional regulator [Nocardioides marmoriginsengisoli]|uniref:ArsR family transcriptional regulator n=1 Tax=Nocardioides marmoriginsengisoli TaxID=661483 RepID=A0A3N0CCX1_9ACTN|nr:metalloregulator ArsR/SmtB family transcription factor [Nocardioides marmoriginsengisoli]RNL61258.1 ArsR family transcriptional regulator [Nocardioides marmoriginsengisoli]